MKIPRYAKQILYTEFLTKQTVPQCTEGGYNDTGIVTHHSY